MNNFSIMDTTKTIQNCCIQQKKLRFRAALKQLVLECTRISLRVECFVKIFLNYSSICPPPSTDVKKLTSIWPLFIWNHFTLVSVNWEKILIRLYHLIEMQWSATWKKWLNKTLRILKEMRTYFYQVPNTTMTKLFGQEAREQYLINFNLLIYRFLL